MSQNNQLAISFDRIRLVYPSNQLPIAFGQNAPEPPPRRKQIPALEWGVTWSETPSSALCVGFGHDAKPLALEYRASGVDVVDLSACLANRMGDFAGLDAVGDVAWREPVGLHSCQQQASSYAVSLNACDAVAMGAQVHLAGCSKGAVSAVALLPTCADANQTAVADVARGETVQWAGQSWKNCQSTSMSHAVPVPCEWYPIILPPPNQDNGKRPCGAIPQGNRVPLNFTRRNVPYASNQLPLHFSCNDDFAFVSPLESYVMLNKITATAGDVVLDPLSVNARADMSGYCWSCDMTLSPDDFAKLNLDQQKLGDEVLITLTINDDVFVFMAENDSDTRQFPNKQYTVSGRSQTAKLGADYAVHGQGVIAYDLYASQIAQQQVADLGFEVEWEAVDWLIPANTYVLTDKTPIAVIQDLAQVAGAFVYSHPSERKLFVKPRWRVPAWELNTASPALTVPSNIILKIRGQKNVQTQCNGVFVWGSTTAGNVMRQGTDGEPRAEVRNHVAYTDLQVCQSAGVAILSDTGTHKTETVTLPIMAKYGLGIAEIGRVWRFNESHGAWNAVVQGVAISVSVENDVPVIKQDVTADRYLGT